MAKNKPIKVIVDTNIWISFIISRKLSSLDFLLYSGKLRIIMSHNLISEIESTLEKPKLQKYFLAKGLEEMLIAFDPFIDFVETKNKVKLCRDPKDDFLLGLAKDGKADYIITGDKDLLDLIKFRKTKIITISDFLDINFDSISIPHT